MSSFHRPTLASLVHLVPALGAALALLLAGGACVGGDAQAAEAKSATLNGQVQAQRWKGIRLRRLPRGTSLALQLEVDGPVSLLLLYEREFRRFPGEGRPAFETAVDDRVGFSMKLPESGDYYVIIDNREGTRAREFTITLRAAAPDA